MLREQNGILDTAEGGQPTEAMETLQAAASALLRQLIKHDAAQQDGEPSVSLHLTRTVLAKAIPLIQPCTCLRQATVLAWPPEARSSLALWQGRRLWRAPGSYYRTNSPQIDACQGRGTYIRLRGTGAAFVVSKALQ